MVSAQTLKLLDALLPGSGGEEKERLLALYKEAFCGTESFKSLKTLLEQCEFHGSVGQELLSKGENVIKDGFANAGSFGDQITVMDYVVEKMQQELDAATGYVRSDNVSGAQLNVLNKRFADTATKYYEMLFNYVCCLYASMYGNDILKNLKVKTGIRSADLIRNVNDELCSLVAEAGRQKKPRMWRILRKHFGGANLVNYDGFVLEYSSLGAAYLREQCEQVSPLLYRDRKNSDVLCCGIGYLTSLEPRDGGRVYGAQVISKPALNCLDSYDMDYRNLNVRLLLNTIAGSGVCIIDPKDLVELLNRYFMVKTAKANQQKGCTYCGRTNCQHFRINKEFTM